MNLLQPPIDEYKIACGKVDRRTLTTFPQALRLRWMFPIKGTSLLWVDMMTLMLSFMRIYPGNKFGLSRIHVRIKVNPRY